VFNKDGLFSKKDETPAAPAPARSVNVTPDLRGSGMRPAFGAHDESPQSHATPQQGTRTNNEELAGSKLIVGPDIKLKGVEITDCDTLVVEGRVEASMDSRVVQIAENGIFNGTATMDVAEIWGSFEGTLTARKQLVIYATGRVAGTIRYGKIRIEEGGELSGDVSTLSRGHAAAPRPESQARPQAETKDTAYEPVQRQQKAPVKA
jgi:cytoskeletal protein CcmA (bactofilin family)